MKSLRRGNGSKKRQAGQGLAEYAFILGLVAVLAIVALTLIGTGVDGVLSTIANAL